MIARSEEEKPRLPTECKIRMQQIRRVCVYCGSSGAVDDRYRDAASELGRSLAAAGIGLVFGGGRIGLMGLPPKTSPMIPAALRDRELAHQGVSELVIVGNMHERKRMMTEKAD